LKPFAKDVRPASARVKLVALDSAGERTMLAGKTQETA
jgi:hypothetical protein